MADPQPLKPGEPTKLGAYELTGRLGEGGQGVVYKGRGPAGEQVAVKLLRTQFAGDARARERFVRELAVAERVAGFCTARVLDAETQGDQPYIVSEFVPGPSLQEFVRQAGPQRGDDLIRLAIGTATALAAIHEAGIVHRDFKPPNVLMGPDGPRVIDFGISRALDASSSITSQVIGTPSYMAPEQIAAQPVGPYTDMFAWGLTILFAATGASPFVADSIPAVLHKVLHEQVDVRPLPEPLAGLVNACLSKDPAGRPTATQALLTLLGAVGAAPGYGPPAHALTQGAALAAAQTVPTFQIPSRPKASGWAAIPAVISGAIAVGFSGRSFGTGIPYVMRALHVSTSELHWLNDLYPLAVLALAFPAGRLADRFGRKKVFIAGAASLAVFSFLAGLSPNLAMLVGLRAFQGLAAGLLTGTTLAVLRAAFPSARPAMPVGVWVAASALGLGISPLLATELAANTSWRNVLLVSTIPALAALLLGAALLRESRGRAEFPPGELLLTAALVLLVFGTQQGFAHGWLQVIAILPIVAGVALCVVSLAVTRPPLSGLLQSPGTIATALLVGVTAFGMIAVELYVSLSLMGIHGQSLLSASGTWGAWCLAAVAGAVLTGRLVAGGRIRPAIVLGSALTGSSLLGMAALGDSLLMAYVWMAMAGAGFTMVGVAATAVLAEATPEPLAGVLGGLHTSAFSVATVMATATLFGIVTDLQRVSAGDPVGAYHSAVLVALLIGGAVVLAAALLASFVRPVGKSLGAGAEAGAGGGGGVGDRDPRDAAVGAQPWGELR